jgi:hypothetical protein
MRKGPHGCSEPVRCLERCAGRAERRPWIDGKRCNRLTREPEPWSRTVQDPDDPTGFHSVETAPGQRDSGHRRPTARTESDHDAIELLSASDALDGRAKDIAVSPRHEVHERLVDEAGTRDVEELGRVVVGELNHAAQRGFNARYRKCREIIAIRYLNICAETKARVVASSGVRCERLRAGSRIRQPNVLSVGSLASVL